MWVYRSPVGTFCIRRLQNGFYCLMRDDVILECSDNPQAEADNFYMQVTGCSAWDSFDVSGVDVPRDLSEWEPA